MRNLRRLGERDGVWAVEWGVVVCSGSVQWWDCCMRKYLAEEAAPLSRKRQASVRMVVTRRVRGRIGAVNPRVFLRIRPVLSGCTRWVQRRMRG